VTVDIDDFLTVVHRASFFLVEILRAAQNDRSGSGYLSLPTVILSVSEGSRFVLVIKSNN
jgi:hypothetical protein